MWVPAKSGLENSIAFWQVDGKTQRRKKWKKFVRPGDSRLEGFGTIIRIAQKGGLIWDRLTFASCLRIMQ